MSGDAHTGVCTKTAQDTGLPTGYVPSSQCNGVFCSMDFHCIVTYCMLTNSYEYLHNPLVVIHALLLGSMVMKVMFTVCIVIHLFALAVFYKNLQRLEPFYVASSLLVPMIVTAVILPIRVVNEHHVISIEVCFIQDIMYTITFAV